MDFRHRISSSIEDLTMQKTQVTAALAVVAASLLTTVVWIGTRSPSPAPPTIPAPAPVAKTWTPAELEAQCRALFVQELELPANSVVTVPAEEGRSVAQPSAYDWRGTVEIEAEAFQPNRRPFQCNPQGDGVQIIRRPDTYDPKIDKP
jgi:hypothetical protein